MARSVSGGAPPPSRAPEDDFKPLRRNHLRDPPLSVGASAPPPVRDQGPGQSLPGPDAGHPLQAAGSHGKEEDRRAISVQSDRVTSGQSRVAPVHEVGWSATSQAMICPIPKLIVQVAAVPYKRDHP